MSAAPALAIGHRPAAAVLAMIPLRSGGQTYIMETGFRERQGTSPYFNRIMRFARTPQGRQMMSSAGRYARSPQARRHLDVVRREIGSRRAARRTR